MREWYFDNGIKVTENEYDHDLHCFKVYNGDTYLGTVYPDCIEDMGKCIEDLDDDTDPISGQWEDGLGHGCTMEGWA